MEQAGAAITNVAVNCTADPRLDKQEEGSNVIKVTTATSARRARPRTLAAARQQKNEIASASKKPERGAPGNGVAVDLKGTSFEAYDAVFIAAVQERWHYWLNRTHFIPRACKVVLKFNLNSDGRVTDLKITCCEAGVILGLLCELAVLDSAPYAPWPPDMRSMLGANYRSMTFTFYYF